MSRGSAVAGTLFVSLGAQRVEAAVQVRGRWVDGSAVALAIEPAPGSEPQSVAVALAQALLPVGEALRRWRESPQAQGVALQDLRVRVADCWLSWATLPWSDDLTHPTTAEPYLRAHLAASGCPCEAADSVGVDDAGYGQPRVVVRFPAALVKAAAHLSNSLGLVLRSLRPMSVAAWTIRPGGGMRALAVLDAGCTVVVQGGRRISEVTVRGQVTGLAEGGTPAHALQGLWNRLRARDAQLAAVPRLAVLDAAAMLDDAPLPASLQAVPWPAPPPGLSLRLHLAALAAPRHTALDAVPGAAVPPRWLRWLRWAAAAAVAAALLGGVEAWQLARQAQAAQAEWLALRETPAPVLRQAPWSREDLARVAAVNAAVRELNLPISALLAALQPPAGLRVAVLGVDVAAGQPVEAGGASRVKIAAQAGSGADMARYVAYVAQRRPFDGAYLVRHEIGMDLPDRPYRFTVEASWKD